MPKKTDDLADNLMAELAGLVALAAQRSGARYDTCVDLVTGVLTILDGLSRGPAFDLVSEAGTVNDMLHERWGQYLSEKDKGATRPHSGA